ncbi:hypothetical protein V0288_10885 [Pannus brasiliensis CCIBt3594]|uniref:Uncharacterized protein n=1 Tax=Pannus brasiliensis CCIBt3594 TaxID=1427578 RepID=A0AAW9QXR7_9CHRO
MISGAGGRRQESGGRRQEGKIPLLSPHLPISPPPHLSTSPSLHLPISPSPHLPAPYCTNWKAFKKALVDRVSGRFLGSLTPMT